MNHISHTLDAVVIGTTTIVTAVTTWLLAQAPGVTVSDYEEVKRILLPLIGALVMSGAFLMFNPSPETRPIIIGRGIFGVFFGVLLPQIIGEFHPALQSLALKPPVLILSGGITAGVAFVLSKPFTRGMYERADRVAKRELDRLERQRITRDEHVPD